MHAVTYDYTMIGRWIRSGNDRGSYTEIEGDALVHWADGTFTKYDFIPRRYKKNTQKIFVEKLFEPKTHSGVRDVLPTKVQFDPREDDDIDKEDKRDDDLGTAWVEIDQMHLAGHEYEGDETLNKQVKHRRDGNEFWFGFEWTPRITF